MSHIVHSAESLTARFTILPGLLLSLAVTLAAEAGERLETQLFGRAWLEALVLAIILGALWRHFAQPGERFRPGIAWSGKFLLEVAVVLLGASISTAAIAGAGPVFVATIACVVVVSIEPNEGTDLAAAKKRGYLKRYGHLETADGWHFLTGTQANIDALTAAVGFKYVKLEAPGGATQFAHASSIQIVTPEGKLAQYYMGVEYSPKDLLLGLNEASANRIGSPVDNILTYCYHYDPQRNTHSLIVARVVQLGGFVTVLLLGGFMALMFRRDYRQAHSAQQVSKVNG